MESPRLAKWCARIGRILIAGAVFFLLRSFIRRNFGGFDVSVLSELQNDFYAATGTGVGGCVFLWLASCFGRKMSGVSHDSPLDVNDPAALAAAERREWEVVRCFWISCLMLLVPVGEVVFPPHPPWFATLWLVSGAVGLFFGIQSCRLASSKTNGFGSLAVALHVVSLMVLTVLSVPNGG
jgi:hypothetical protein